ncbi:hypothetical protein J3E72DRAFT_49761 [Bipolaris maydis]|uniref:uncharacterized protein n=1 Tax=Cochliobolus heterostrophus TaxID=5016 RepID=UPI0024CF8F00|nr:hypothetical protein J3E73DRAFT_45471 [Bipolaris maydis]KAJ5026123.1 hypothetical protein J3E73DRAFT_47138 [Bipolaris maydis]KAJ5042616.1 hypothetical protein J3E74DRAFT_35647 [Bipolaris maydis]KAJ5056660.1 hypothetical protein J3E74DRAFT_14855 [Bipolaris maydis]KAJ6196248.1 hypothetical protein J3E72DRAFT_49761 [Bipolaris maydis]
MSPSNILFKLARAHPYQTILHALNGAIFLEPRVFTVPTFRALGFEQRGPRKDSTASTWMRIKDTSSTQNIYSTLQSGAMGGKGVNSVDTAVRAGAIILSVAVWRRGRR